MSGPATSTAGGLRVFVAAADPARRRLRAAMLVEAGFTIVEAAERADVVLSDGAGNDPERPGGVPVVSLGGREAGQAGRLSRDAAPAQIAAAIGAVAAGLIVHSREDADDTAARPAFHALGETAPPLLTPREVEVLSAIGDGLSNKAVARRLGISQHTVKFHVEALLRKLGAASRAEAVHKGLRERLIEM